MKVKAIVKTIPGPGAEYLDFILPEMGPYDVLVKPLACAICGTDIHIYEWNEWAAKTFIKAYGTLPRVLGHEFVGKVVKIGENVRKVKIGDRVAAETHIPCGICFQCRTGNSYNCENLTRFKTGVFAEYTIIPEICAEIVPENIPDHVASLFEPFGVAIHAVSQLRIIGESVVVIGSGPIGLFLILLSKIMGAVRIISTDISDFRLELAKKIGADITINVKKEDFVKIIKEITSGLGVGVVIDTSGNVKAMKQGFEILRRCGTYCMIGLPSEPLILEASSDIVWKGAIIRGIYGRELFTTWEIAKNLLSSGKINLEPIITHKFSFKDYKKAFDLCLSQKAGKVLLLPD